MFCFEEQCILRDFDKKSLTTSRPYSYRDYAYDIEQRLMYVPTLADVVTFERAAAFLRNNRQIWEFSCQMGTAAYRDDLDLRVLRIRETLLIPTRRDAEPLKKYALIIMKNADKII